MHDLFALVHDFACGYRSHVTSMPTSKLVSVLVAISHVRAFLLKWRD